MSQIQAEPAAPAMPLLPRSAGIPVTLPDNRLLVRNIDWPTYRKISEAFTGVLVRITYDRGTLEIMTKSCEHETWKVFLGRLIFALGEETDQPIRGCGEMTCDREDLARGIEPDDCYYITNEPRMRGRKSLVLGKDPAPDLTLEIEISRSVIPKLPIYAALEVPEVWRFDGNDLAFLRLAPDGQYYAIERSRYFPFLTPGELFSVLRRWGETDDNTLVREFREWIRQQRGQS